MCFLTQPSQLLRLEISTRTTLARDPLELGLRLILVIIKWLTYKCAQPGSHLWFYDMIEFLSIVEITALLTS